MLSTTEVQLLPHTLIFYMGGCYPGCHCEWNIAYIDDQGEFHDVYSSGSLGCPTHEKLVAALTDGRVHDSYALGNPEDRNRCADREAWDWLYGVGKVFAAKGWPDAPQPKCSQCGQRFDMLAGMMTGLQGNGGIGIRHTGAVCETCTAIGTCSQCDEYLGKEELDEDGVCKYCLEELDNDV